MENHAKRALLFVSFVYYTFFFSNLNQFAAWRKCNNVLIISTTHASQKKEKNIYNLDRETHERFSSVLIVGIRYCSVPVHVRNNCQKDLVEIFPFHICL